VRTRNEGSLELAPELSLHCRYHPPPTMRMATIPIAFSEQKSGRTGRRNVVPECWRWTTHLWNGPDGSGGAGSGVEGSRFSGQKSMNFQQFLFFFPCTGLTVSGWIRPSFVPSPAHSSSSRLLPPPDGNRQHGILSVSVNCSPEDLDDAGDIAKAHSATTSTRSMSQKGPGTRTILWASRQTAPAVNASS
jgi:hypothetical protein